MLGAKLKIKFVSFFVVVIIISVVVFHHLKNKTEQKGESSVANSYTAPVHKAGLRVDADKDSFPSKNIDAKDAAGSNHGGEPNAGKIPNVDQLKNHCLMDVGLDCNAEKNYFLAMLPDLVAAPDINFNEPRDKIFELKESNQEEKEVRINTLKALKERADLGEVKAQYLYASYLSSHIVGDYSGKKRLAEERDQYFIKAAAGGDFRAALAMTPKGLSPNNPDPIDTVAWHLIAEKLNSPFSVLIRCHKQEIECSTDVFRQAAVRAKLYINTYGFKRS